jgi:hypothetical protein
MEQSIPDFMQKYFNGSNSQGRDAITKLAAAYEDEKRHFFETTFNKKQSFQRDWNKLTGGKKELTHDEAWAPQQKIYTEKVAIIAYSNGYKEPLVDERQVSKMPNRPTAKTKEQFLENLKLMRNDQKPIRPRQ